MHTCSHISLVCIHYRHRVCNINFNSTIVEIYLKLIFEVGCIGIPSFYYKTKTKEQKRESIVVDQLICAGHDSWRPMLIGQILDERLMFIVCTSSLCNMSFLTNYFALRFGYIIYLYYLFYWILKLFSISNFEGEPHVLWLLSSNKFNSMRLLHRLSTYIIGISNLHIFQWIVHRKKK